MDSAPPRIKALLDEVWSLEQSAMDSQDQALAAAIYCEAARYGNPEDNIRGGLAYLRWLHRRFSGDLSKVVAAYNAGEGAADRHGGKDAGLI